MKKLYILFMSCICGFSVLAQQSDKPQLSARTQGFLKKLESAQDKNKAIEGYAYRTLSDGQQYASALIKVSNAALAAKNLSLLGAKVGTKAGDIWTVQVPANNLYSFFETEGIKYIEIDQPVFPQLDQARIKTRVDSVHAGYGLPMPYTGKDVVLGIMDFGFDYNNPTFYDTLGSTFRIKRVWELAATGTPPSGYSYGNEITDTTSIKNQGTDNPEQMHGTSVAGIAIGSGVGSQPAGIYRGIAYESDVVLVGVRRDTLGDQWMHGTFTDFVDGIAYMFNYATSVGKPAVVNISWGSQTGAHDGTSLFNQACNNLSGPGRIIIMSAGNDGTDPIHLSKTFTTTDTTISSFVTFSDHVYNRTWLDVWGETGKSFCGAISLYDNGSLTNTTGFFCADGSSQNYYLIGKSGTDTCYIEVNSSASEINNQKPHIFVNVYNKTADSIVFTLKGNDGTVHAWDESYFYGFVHSYSSRFDNLGMTWATNGNSNYTTSDMGAADSVILIGAYMSKKGWTDINGSIHSYSGLLNNIASFSSKGPYVDGRIKPDITAPGFTVTTAVTSYDTSYTPTGSNSDLVAKGYVFPATGKTYYFNQFSGTSASAPVTSGIVALLLQAKQDLSVDELRNLIFETAIHDYFTDSIGLGTDVWGHGKINAYGAIKKLIQSTGLYEFSGQKLDCILYPNPNQGIFNLDYTGKKDETLFITISDVQGRVVATDKWQVNAGFNQRDVNLGNGSKGTYFVKLHSLQGSVVIKTIIH